MTGLRYSNEAMICLACGSPSTRRKRRTLTCRQCEVCYVIPGHLLVAQAVPRPAAQSHRPPFRKREHRSRREAAE